MDAYLSKQFSILALLCTALPLIPLIYSLPFVVFHGIGDKCNNAGITEFTELLSNWSDSQGYCIQIGRGAWDSWTIPLIEQTAIACEKVKEINELTEGYNMIALSQGALIARGVIEFCDGAPPVKNFISLAGPHAGIASIPFCGSELVCSIVAFLMELEIYSNFIQEHLAPSGFIKIPTDVDDYLRGCRFLPKLNNEVAGERNDTYKRRFSSLHNLMLIMFDQDSVLVPRETSWFGYYPDGALDRILPAQKTKLYIEDWIGLKTLDEENKVKFIELPGSHLEISRGDMIKYIVPYLKDQASHSAAAVKIMETPSRSGMSITKLLLKLLTVNAAAPPLLRVVH